MDDYRVKVGWMTHPKRRKLRKRLGADGVLGFQDLWEFCAASRTDGDLAGLTAEDLALAVDYPGDAFEWVSVLVELGLLDSNERPLNGRSNGFFVHDWSDHNPWVAGFKKRSQRAKRAGKASGKSRAETVNSNGNPITVQRKPKNRSTGNAKPLNPISVSDSVTNSISDTDTKIKNCEGVSQVWGHWRTHHPRAAQDLKKGMKGYKLITARLKEGKSVEDLKQAIDGLHLDPWEDRKNFLQLKYVFGDDDLVTKFIGFAANPPSTLSPRTQRTVQAAKQWLAQGEKNGTEG